MYTTFFMAGKPFQKPGINLILDVVFLYTNSKTLEEGNYPYRSADYAWHLILSAVSILVLTFRRWEHRNPYPDHPLLTRLSTFHLNLAFTSDHSSYP
jgi:hypothetical protein